MLFVRKKNGFVSLNEIVGWAEIMIHVNELRIRCIRDKYIFVYVPNVIFFTISVFWDRPKM